jgi:hypothetical protein
VIDWLVWCLRIDDSGSKVNRDRVETAQAAWNAFVQTFRPSSTSLSATDICFLLEADVQKKLAIISIIERKPFVDRSSSKQGSQ